MEQLKINLGDIDRIELIGGTARKRASAIFSSLNDKPDYIINGGMYDTNSGLTVCDTIIEGKLINGGNYTDKGFAWNDNNIEPTTTGSAIASKHKFFLGGAPTLVWQAEEYMDMKGLSNAYRNNNTYRIGIGINGSDLVVCFPSRKMNLDALQSKMLAEGCIYAINLDGGGSTRVTQNVDGKLTQLSANTEDRANSTWIAIYLKKDKQPEPKKYKVMIDAGHGQSDSGAVGNGVKEKDVALDIALKVGKLLESAGVEVSYTRTDDKRLVDISGDDLTLRAKKANEAKVDYFVSIHCNAAQDSSASGIETYCVSLKEITEGYKLAKSVQSKLTQSGEWKSRGVKSASFYVIKKTEMPAILVELGFVTNQNDAKKLQIDTERTDLALSVASGICDYLDLKLQDTALNQIVESNFFVKLQNGKELAAYCDMINKNGFNYVKIRDLAAAVGAKVELKDGKPYLIMNEE